MVSNFENLMYHLPVSIILYNSADETIKYFNKATTHLFGTAVNSELISALKQMGVNHNILAEYIAEYKGISYQLYINELNFEDNFENTSVFLIAINNITSAEQDQKHKTEKKYEYIYFNTITHELRTPLNAIKSMLLLLNSCVTKSGKEYLDIAINACKIQKSLINNAIVLP
jgi:signal transduction histidine kinase